MTYDQVAMCACIYQSNIEDLVCAHLGFPCGSMVKNPLANAGDMGSIPGSGRSPEEVSGNRSRILAWGIPWTEEPGGLVHEVAK